MLFMAAASPFKATGGLFYSDGVCKSPDMDGPGQVFKIFTKIIWKFRKSDYLCVPFGNEGLRNSSFES